MPSIEKANKKVAPRRHKSSSSLEDVFPVVESSAKIGIRFCFLY